MSRDAFLEHAERRPAATRCPTVPAVVSSALRPRRLANVKGHARYPLQLVIMFQVVLGDSGFAWAYVFACLCRDIAWGDQNR
jgi:hypothetical protein